METFIVEIECLDSKGLVSAVTNTLYQNDLNIVAAWGFLHKGDNLFYLRADAEGKGDKNALLNQLQDALPEGADIRVS